MGMGACPILWPNANAPPPDIPWRGPHWVGTVPGLSKQLYVFRKQYGTGLSDFVDHPQANAPPMETFYSRMGGWERQK